MNSKKIFLNNSGFSKNNNIEIEKKLKFKSGLNNSNYFIKNSNNSKDHISENKKNIFNGNQNKMFHKELEDFYKFEIYKNSIGKFNFGHLDKENLYKYQTVSVTNSFQNNYKKIFNFEKYRSYQKRSDISPIELSSELNLSFETKNNKYLILRKPFNFLNDDSHLISIIRIFDKSHKQVNKINEKNFKNLNNHFFVYKNRINNYNYLKFKTTSKFSKKNKNKILKNVQSIESHIKLNSEPINNRKIISINIDNKEYRNKVIEKRYANNIDFKKDNNSDIIKDIRSKNNNIYNNVNIEQRNLLIDNKLLYKDYNKNNINIPIELNKNLIISTTENSSESKENNSNRNSVNFCGKIFSKYNNINNIVRNRKSIFEENEKNNNNDKSINKFNQQSEQIKKGQIIKIENIGNNRILYKKVQRNEINKNQNKINVNTKQIKIESNQNNIKGKNFENKIILTTPKKEQNSTNVDKNINISLNLNKRNKNMYLLNQKHEYLNNNQKINNNEESNSITMNLRRSYNPSNQNASKNLETEKKNNKDLKNPVNSSINVKNSKNIINNNIAISNDKNIFNNRKFILNSDKSNKSQIIYKNYNYKEINTKNNDIRQKNESPKEKVVYLKTERFKKRIELNKSNDITKIEELPSLIVKNKKNENPFRSNNNCNNLRKTSNRYENHKFHEINSTSCEKNNKIIQNQKENNHISYKIENKAENKIIAPSSMRYINLKRKINYLKKEKNIDNKEEDEKHI